MSYSFDNNSICLYIYYLIFNKPEINILLLGIPNLKLF